MVKKYSSYSLGQTDEKGFYPDLVSERHETGKPRVGLLGFGWFEWWRMYPEQKQKTIKSLEVIVEQLKSSEEFELVYPGMVDTMDKADTAGRTFREKRIDLLVVAEVVYVPDYFVVQAKRYVDGVPVIIYLSQRSKNIPEDITYRELMGDSSMIGSTQLAGAFAKAGWPYEVVICPIGDERLPEYVSRRCKVIHTARWLKHAKLGVYAHPFRGMFDIEYDKTKLQATVGPESIYIEERNLVSALKQINDNTIKELANQVKGRFRIDPDLKESDLHDACRLAIAIEKLVKDYKLDALSLLGQYNLELLARDNGGLASSLLLEKDFIAVCEGDSSTVAMMMVMKRLTGGGPVYWGEYTMYDVDKNAFLFNHHGDGDPRLAHSDKDIYLTYCAENWGTDALALEFVLKPGEYTLGSFIDDAEGFKFLITRGECLDIPTFRIQTPHALIRTERPVVEFFEDIMRYGFRHHAALCPGDMVEELSMLADALGARKVVL